jgi:hypothetical protein
MDFGIEVDWNFPLRRMAKMLVMDLRESSND